MTFVLGIIVVLGAASAAALIGLVVRTRVEFDHHRDTTPLGTILTIVTGLHAVFVVFVLVGVIETAGAARQATSREADNLVATVWAADALPPEVKARVRVQARDYARVVVKQEWPRLQNGEPVGPQGWNVLQQLRHTIAAGPAFTDVELDRRAEASDRVVDTYLARQARLAAAEGEVTPIIWYILVTGTIVSTVLPYLYGGTKVASYTVLVATVAGVFAMLLFAISQLQNPFSASGSVSPDPLRVLVERLDGGTLCSHEPC